MRPRSTPAPVAHRSGRHRRRLFRGMLRSYWLMLSLLVLVLSGLAMVQATESSRQAAAGPGVSGGPSPRPSDMDPGGTATASPMTASTAGSGVATRSPADEVPVVPPVVPVVSASVALTPATPAVPPVVAPATCRVGYVVQQWIGGFVASVQIVNTSSTSISRWVLQFTFPDDQVVIDAWDVSLTQSNKLVTGESMLYNRVINPGQGIVVGFRATYGTVNSHPTEFTVNGRSCEVS